MGEDLDIFADTRYTAEISNRMQVPDRIMVNSGNNDLPFKDNLSPASSTLSMNMDMRVPDRIVLGGGSSLGGSGGKSLPRELQLENSTAIGYPTSEQVRVSTPPRSIRLDQISYPSEEPSPSNSHPNQRRRLSNSTMESNDPSLYRDTSLTLSSGGGGATALNPAERDLNLSPWEEIQILRRQMAKYNHRLMAVELENQQQQQREMVLTALVSVYFIGKLILWINRSN